MIKKILIFVVAISSQLITASIDPNPNENTQNTSLNKLSEEFLKAIEEGKNTQSYKDKLAALTVETIEKELNTDTKKKAFWINIYNAFIQDILSKQPELYEDRGKFFGDDQITIAGEQISFDKIEHGILRHSQSKIGMGYVGKIFTDRFERNLRVEEVDYHIHFALNCGAKDCPPVAIYNPERLDEQFALGTKKFLKSSTEYDPKTKVAKVTSLFSWFRGDFGGLDGVREILREQKLIPENEEVDLEFKDYNWTLDLNNFIDL